MTTEILIGIIALVMAALSLVASVVELVYLVAIYKDDHKMVKMAEDSLVIQQKSLDAQEKYLAMRQRWYDARVKKTDPPVPDTKTISAGG